MSDCVICGDPIVKECVKIQESSKKKYNLERVCVWCALDVINGKILAPESSPNELHGR